MRTLKVKVIECDTQEAFCGEVEAFCIGLDIFEIKFQRNLFYAGVGSSAGRTPGVTGACPPVEELKERYVAFIAYRVDV